MGILILLCIVLALVVFVLMSMAGYLLFNGKSTHDEFALFASLIGILIGCCMLFFMIKNLS